MGGYVYSAIFTVWHLW